MKVIAFVNNKGGVGKTTCSKLLAEYLSKVKKIKTLAIDFDPQCSFSSRFLKMEKDIASKVSRLPPIHPDYDPYDPDCEGWDGRSSIADIFYGEGVIPYPTYIENLDIAAGNGEKLLAAEAVRKNEVVDKVHHRLYEFLHDEEVQKTYDVFVIDTAPSKGPLTTAAIKAATHIVIPTQMEEQSIEGLEGILQMWMQQSLVRPKHLPLNLIGILPTLHISSTNLHRQMLESLRNAECIGKYVLPFQLARRITFAELDSEGANPRSIFDLKENDAAKRDAVTMCEHIYQEMFK